MLYHTIILLYVVIKNTQTLRNHEENKNVFRRIKYFQYINVCMNVCMKKLFLTSLEQFNNTCY